ncbi:DUF4142 domain-containing protein [Aquabacterium sp. J223]|uniref:DUF4142 domain-containing protein n=1 Tax=Aquabacterium sp. J223 TaxID=2898431 RepID=UPI0021ADE207|nr:DUF4142 domain-containing protein [Aquabacterium sp. J223]UUX96035.1 DUF4142 domain-containing protein [Aquabacterium sp. J223]
MNNSLRTLALVAAMAAAGVVHAQSGTTGSSTSGNAAATPGGAARQTANDDNRRGGEAKLPRADAGFLKQAAQNSLAEVEASKLAQSKATSADVKAFASQMIDDHTKANAELMQLAQSKGLEVPKEPSVAQKAKMKLLEASDGDKFDRRYSEQIGVKAHEDTVKLFQKASQSAQDPQVKAWATKMLPSLQHHLQMAKDVNAKVGGGEKSASADKATTRQ